MKYLIKNPWFEGKMVNGRRLHPDLIPQLKKRCDNIPFYNGGQFVGMVVYKDNELIVDLGDEFVEEMMQTVFPALKLLAELYEEINGEIIITRASPISMFFCTNDNGGSFIRKG